MLRAQMMPLSSAMHSCANAARRSAVLLCGPSTRIHSAASTSTATRESRVHVLHIACGARAGHTLLTSGAWCDRFDSCCMADDCCSHLQPQHSSSNIHQPLLVRAHYSTPVCMRWVHSHGLSLRRCLCDARDFEFVWQRRPLCLRNRNSLPERIVTTITLQQQYHEV